MLTCPDCAEQIEPGWKVCPFCGFELTRHARVSEVVDKPRAETVPEESSPISERRPSTTQAWEATDFVPHVRRDGRTTWRRRLAIGLPALIILGGIFLLGFAVGFGVGGNGSEAIPSQTVTLRETEAVTLAPSQEELEAIEARKVRLDERAAKLSGRERELDARERQISRQESIIAKSTFGDGTYLVGVDIPAGSYRAPGSEACYWERRRQGNTGLDAIIENYVGAGQVRVTVSEGELFNTQRCGTWRPA